MKKKVFFATRARGFFKHLFANENIEYEFINKNGFYELNGRKRKMIYNIAKSKLFDQLGVIQVIKVKNKDGDINGSFNRFLDSDKPYFIYVENPTALYHYSLERKKSIIGKRIISKKLGGKEQLKAIICMSQACYNTFDEVCGEWQGKEELKQVIYPLVPKNVHVNESKIKEKAQNSEINLLFIAQGGRFVSKGGLEVIKAYENLREEGRNVNLTLVTSIKEIDVEILKIITSNKQIKLLDFNLSYNELEKLYANSTLLLHPTSDDSFGLTILEGMKAGLPIISTHLYAISEMVLDGVNGYLTEPKWWFFDENNLPNPEVWNNRGETIQSTVTDDRIVSFLKEKISYLDENRDLLCKMALNSLKIANSKPFDEETIIESWNRLLKDIDKN